MAAADLDPTSLDVLRTFAEMEQRRLVPTVQAAAIGARASYMDAYDIVNRLFTGGFLQHDLKVTEAGRKAIA
jgi:hypothetical protein